MDPQDREAPLRFTGTMASLAGSIEELSSICARLRFPFDARWCNPRGSVQGGIIAAYLDDCMGYAMVGRFGQGTKFTTMSLTVNYLRPITRGDIIAEGRVVRAGKRTAYLEGDILNEKGELVARGVSTVMLLP